MARDNKTLGRFELMGISPAPRGAPQIEVTFDIDANGIVNVARQGSRHGKEQSIRITASSGLSQEEIDRAIQDAQLHAAEDRQKKDLVEARNGADGLVYATEKTLREGGGQVEPGLRSSVEESLASLKKAMAGEDAGEIRRQTEMLTQVVHRMSEAACPSSPHTQGPTATDAGGHGGGFSGGEDCVEAEYEEVA